MIDPQDFIRRAAAREFSWYAGVPCSFLGPLINAAIRDDAVPYRGAANEGDAVAMAAGAFLGGRRGVAMMQNSGLGNAVSPLTSLTWPFRLPVLLLVTLRGDPAIGDEPQHELMGGITCDLLDRMQVPWHEMPRETTDLDAVLDRADEQLRTEERPVALVIRKGAFSSGDVRPEATACFGREPAVARDAPVHECAALLRRGEALHAIVDATPAEGTVVIATTGFTGRELYAIDDRPNHFYMVGSMGCAASLGLGLADARPDLRVVVIDGDGSALMRMGNFATIGAYGGSNLVHIVLDNGAHESTGGQSTVSRGMSFAAIAHACGYTCSAGAGLESIEHALAADDAAGPRFAHVRLQPDTSRKLPRPALSPHAVRERFMGHIGSLVT